MATSSEHFKRMRVEGLCSGCSQRAVAVGVNTRTGKPFRVCEQCRDANKQRQQERRQKRLDEGLCYLCGKHPQQFNRRLCGQCRQKYINSTRVSTRVTAKVQAMEAYGGVVCNCCSESELMMLTIDHVYNNGAEHRKASSYNGRSINCNNGIYGWLRKNNYPEGFQVLCFNCNMAKHLNGGACPHLAGTAAQDRLEEA
jgi:hypothetical protein